MRKGFLLFVFISVVVIAALIGFSGIDVRTEVGTLLNRKSSATVATATVTVQNAVIRAEVARSPEERARGLSGRDGLQPLTGMLFVFETAGKHSFWMKDMRFPLDFIWINNGTVIAVNENVPAPTGGSPAVIAPPADITQVLEVPAGTVAAHRIIVGSSVSVTFD